MYVHMQYVRVCVYVYRRAEPPSMPHNWAPYHPMCFHSIFRIIWWPQIVVCLCLTQGEYTVNFGSFFQGRCSNLGIESGHKEDETHSLATESQSFLCLILKGYDLLANQVSRSHFWGFDLFTKGVSPSTRCKKKQGMERASTIWFSTLGPYMEWGFGGYGIGFYGWLTFRVWTYPNSQTDPCAYRVYCTCQWL